MRVRAGIAAVLVIPVALAAISGMGQQVVKSPEDSGAGIPEAPREFRGVWVATVANIDWPSRPGLPSQQQKSELVAILDKVVALNMNAVILQVRPQCDALYDSKIEPWSEYLTGQMGRAPSPYYDPLQFAVEEAHKRGLELHAWFNPYRALHNQARSAAANHVSKAHPEIVRKIGEYLWLDPGEQATREYTLKVILDVVGRYDIDGVHIDDYFYPYRDFLQGKDFPDGSSWEKYQKSGGKLNRGDWRRQNVNAFVEQMYKEIKTAKPWVKVGIGPFGIWRPGHPPHVTGSDPYSELYADSKLWWNRGWLDYLSPQLYWEIASKGQPYKDLLRWWAGENTQHRHLWPGNALYKITEGQRTWPAAEIVNQIKATRQQAGATGNALYSARSLTRNSTAVGDALLRQVYQKPALIPPCPWLDGAAPPAPTVQLTIAPGGQSAKLTWSGGSAHRWAVYAKQGAEWYLKVLPGSVAGYEFRSGPGNPMPAGFAVSGLSRLWTEGPRVVAKP